jgi:hypothetical protein
MIRLLTMTLGGESYLNFMVGPTRPAACGFWGGTEQPQRCLRPPPASVARRAARRPPLTSRPPPAAHCPPAPLGQRVRPPRVDRLPPRRLVRPLHRRLRAGCARMRARRGLGLGACTVRMRRLLHVGAAPLRGQAPPRPASRTRAPFLSRSPPAPRQRRQPREVPPPLGPGRRRLPQVQVPGGVRPVRLTAFDRPFDRAPAGRRVAAARWRLARTRLGPCAGRRAS